MNEIKQEDAIQQIIDWIRKGCPSSYTKYGYEVYIPNLLHTYTSDAREQDRISSVYFDAAWELCRRGILRPGVKVVGAQATSHGSGGGGFSLTAFGKKWIDEDQHVFVPTEPERFAEMLEPFKSRFGAGYFERAQQAIRCYGAHAYLACCAMCGAAAESILLATAIARTKDEGQVLKSYCSANGRSRIENLIVGQLKDALKQEFVGLTSLLKYWRDEAAHGQSSNIRDNEAYTSLAMLLRYSGFINLNWKEFTQQKD